MRFNVLFDWICRIPTNAFGYAATESIVHRWIYSAQNWQSERERENPAGHHGDCSHSRHSLVSHIHIPSSKLSLDYNFELCCTVIPSTIPTHMSSIQIASQKRIAKNAVKCYICHLARVHACAMCMGMRFGHMTVKAAAMTIVRDFKITVSPNHKPWMQNPQAFLWSSTNGILLNFEPRK